MATIRRARGYFIYIVAILISAAFALFGRVGPGWAKEAKTDHSAKVFRDGLQGKGLAFTLDEESGRVTGNELPAETTDAIKKYDEQMIDSINDALLKKQELTSEQIMWIKVNSTYAPATTTTTETVAPATLAPKTLAPATTAPKAPYAPK